MAVQFVELVCSNCGKEYKRHPRRLKDSKSGNRYCSHDCFRTMNAAPKINCLVCRKLTKNKKYCSKSCSNRSRNKTKAMKTCKICGGVKAHRSSNCETCNHNIKRFAFYRKQLSTTKGDINHRHGLMRNYSRRMYYFHNSGDCCENCGYNKHIEICHIKPVNDFDDNTKLSIINHPKNLIGLCPNCHWELDNGQLIVKK